MKQKLFINVFFEKKKSLFLFMTIVGLLIFYLGMQIIFFSAQSAKLAMPDVEFNGSADDDGKIRFKLFEPITGFTDEWKKHTTKEIDVYGGTARNLFTQTSKETLQQVHYWIYGVDDDYLDNELSKYIKEGRLPHKGKKEAVLGNYAAHYFQAKVGDKLEVPISLGIEMEMEASGEYTVVGIMEDSVDYFKGALFLSRETYALNHLNWQAEDNVTFLYFRNGSGSQSYKQFMSNNENLLGQYKIETVKYNYLDKYNARKDTMINAIVVIMISMIIILLLILYLMKGITKKIGLLKALGIRDRYLVKVFVGGIGIGIGIAYGLAMIVVVSLTAYLNTKMNNFFGFHTSIYQTDLLVYLITLGFAAILFFVCWVIIKVQSSRISPRDAMLKH